MGMRVFGSSRVLGLGQAVVFVLVLLVAALLPASASAAPSFAPADDATVHPGVRTSTEGGGTCTSDFVFTNGTDVFLGQAAHCAGDGTDLATEINGCTAGSLPLGTPVTVEGASQPGTLAYSSWLAMQAAGETDPNACMFNDFALVRLDPADVASTNPSVPFFGGPTGIDTDGTEMGEPVYSYGNSELLLGQFSPKTGESLGTSGEGWTHSVLTSPPSVPGDSGSAFLTDEGAALGVLSTLTILGPTLPASNGVSDLNLALDYANAQGDLGTLELVPGTEGFQPEAAGGGVLGLLLPF